MVELDRDDIVSDVRSSPQVVAREWEMRRCRCGLSDGCLDSKFEDGAMLLRFSRL